MSGNYYYCHGLLSCHVIHVLHVLSRNMVHTTSFMSCHHGENYMWHSYPGIVSLQASKYVQIKRNILTLLGGSRILATFPERARKSWKSKLKLSRLENQRNVTNHLKTKLKQANFILWSKFTFVLSCTTTICSQCFASSFHRTKRSARAILLPFHAIDMDFDRPGLAPVTLENPVFFAWVPGLFQASYQHQICHVLFVMVLDM